MASSSLQHQYLSLSDDDLQIVQVCDHGQSHQPLLQLCAAIDFISFLKDQIVGRYSERGCQTNQCCEIGLASVGVVVSNAPFAQTGEPCNLALGQTQLGSSSAKISCKRSHGSKMSLTTPRSYVQYESIKLLVLGKIYYDQRVQNGYGRQAKRRGTSLRGQIFSACRILLTPVCMIVAATCMGQETLIDELKHALDLGQQIQLISPAGYPPATQPPIPSVEAAQLLPRAQDGDISSYEGWWQFEGKNGCSDPDYDNWWKVAIGRMEIGGDGPVFGKGLPQIRLYDSGCDLHDLEARDGSLEAAAICQDDEGGVWSGRLTLMAIPQNRLAVSSPLGNHVFERCETGIAAAQEPSPPAVNPPSAPPEPPTSAPIIATAPGIRVVESPAAPLPRPEQQRTTIGTVYRDFCDPGFGNVYDLSGPMDLSLYEPYRNQLWTKYRSDCTSFFALDVAEIVALRDVEALLPPPIGRSLLDTEGAFVLGLWLFFAHASEMNECFGPVENGRSVVHGFPGAALAPLGTRDSLSTIAEGYAGALGLWIEAKRQRRVPPCEIFRTYAEGAMTFRQHNSANFGPSP
ncbi:MAG: hypothetical protein ABS76_38010 [Pelagibacterium sp. SCN 64-44]|nr:MAG: hypothetical protein ABS76_38010 [Pelagibacterium sp. SCN 64-44]